MSNKKQEKTMNAIAGHLLELNKLMFPGATITIDIKKGLIVAPGAEQPNDILIVSKPAMVLNMSAQAQGNNGN